MSNAHTHNDENRPPTSSENMTLSILGVRKERDSSDDDIFTLGARKRPARTDPLVFHGRHFGRAFEAFCKPFPLIKEGVSRHVQLSAKVITKEDLSAREKREHRIFQDLLRLSPGLDQRVMRSSDQELHYIADMFRKGAAASRGDDTKSLKSVIIDWITPQGGSLVPPLSRNVKSDRGYYHFTTGNLLCPAVLNWNDESVRRSLRSGEIVVTGDTWPQFLYIGYKLNEELPWDGFLRSDLLVSAFKHVFTSPSSVEREVRATRSGNAELHGMKSVTIASLAYIATMVRFALSSNAVFTRNDKATASEVFYRDLINFLEKDTEKRELEALLVWWNVKIFPAYHKGSDEVPALPSVKDMITKWRTRTALAEQVGNGQIADPTS
ncbi:hypothetical protein DFP72DRAFT_1084751 [Ephemerocybe angulata]|uniref:Uncharacterized protein n=1 Tax=Ephemerocybe angulata TaxID=980116 RepID=A0A8H6H637_9AGAR|nr:hypothetical protein DFP72DRAFT_1084751 [Tulosesus angulatus]